MNQTNHPVMDEEQRDILFQMVEADQSIAREQRGSFLGYQTLGTHGIQINHPGISSELIISVSDFEHFKREDVISIRRDGKGSYSFVLTIKALTYYRDYRKSQFADMDNISEYIRKYLDTRSFFESFTESYGRWKKASDLLWESSGDDNLTQIGHLCRESIQIFAHDMCNKLGIDDSGLDNTKDIARIKKVIESIKDKSNSKACFYEALMNYWGTVSDLVQRQEHGAQKEGEPLSWEDARLVVFYTALVMHEMARLLSSMKNGK